MNSRKQQYAFFHTLRKRYHYCYFPFLFLITQTVGYSQSPLYQDTSQPIQQRVEDLLQRMTLDEKILITAGMRELGGRKPGDYDGTPAIPRLGIPPFVVIHGPHGINPHGDPNNGVYYPTGITQGATWNPELIRDVAVSMGKELKMAGGHSNAGPGINIIRDLRGGRSFEYFSEDPFLTGTLATAYVRGLQSQDAIAILKHYVANNQERNRNYIDTQVSERALREIYLPGFKMAVQQGNALGIMTGYNAVNGVHNGEQKHLVQDILKNEWGFKGIAMTDWQGSHSTVPMAKSGLDLEMPIPKFYGEKLKKAIQNGEYSEDELDHKVRRILNVLFVTKSMDVPAPENPKITITPEAVELARKTAEEGIVLLKNEGNILPLDPKRIKKIAVIGPNGNWGPHFREGTKSYQLFQGGGSASIVPKPENTVSPLQGIKTKAGDQIEVVFSPGSNGDHGNAIIDSKYLSFDKKPGLQASYYNTVDFQGTPKKEQETVLKHWWNKPPLILEAGDEKQGGDAGKFSVIWEGNITIPESRDYTFEIQAFGASSLEINGEPVIDKGDKGSEWDAHTTGSVRLKKGTYPIKATYQKTSYRANFTLLWDYDNVKYLNDAIKTAKDADIVILTLGTSGYLETEGKDRDQSIALPKPQQHLVEEVTKVNKNVVATTYTAGVTMDGWQDKIRALLHCGFPGQEGGTALANILFGEVNPSGKLTVTIPKSVDQYPEDHYSYTDTIVYTDDIYVGYRYFEKEDKKPAFPFGHGLSYTTFEYKNLKVAQAPKNELEMVVTVEITNTGKVKGKEIVQVYVGDKEASVSRPPKELKAFQKIELNPGETKTVQLDLGRDAFSFFDPETEQWTVEPGDFVIYVGSSSQDIRETTETYMK